MSDPFDETQVDARVRAAESFRRRQAWQMSPAERLELFERLQQQAYATLRDNPDAYQVFLRRNHHQRRASNARRLEALLIRGREEPDG